MVLGNSKLRVHLDHPQGKQPRAGYLVEPWSDPKRLLSAKETRQERPAALEVQGAHH